MFDLSWFLLYLGHTNPSQALMKNACYFFLLLVGFFLFTPPTHSQEVKLGLFSQDEINYLLENQVFFRIKEEATKLSQKELFLWLSEENQLRYRENYRSEIENGNLCQLQKQPLCKLTHSYRQEESIKKEIQQNLDQELVEAYLEKLAEQFDKEPKDPKMKIENGKVSVFSLSENGQAIDIEESLRLITERLKEKNFSGEINLAVKEIEPKIDIGSINQLGIDTLLGEGHSNFKGSPTNRIFNINVATERFDGVLIKPGEEFSFVEILGEVDGEHGYLPELVIKKDKTEKEFGGGICQVSTTVFRAAINSGLEITARRNHAYPVSYYNPQGMDATIYVPKPDLKFMNDTPGHILIQAQITGTELTFQFFGTSDGRKTTVIGPTVLEKNPDGSMKTTFTQQIHDKDGNLLREDEFKSAYESPAKFPHPGETSGLLTKKPKNWSDREWKNYKKEHGLD